MSVSVRLSPSRISIAPGGTQTVTVTVANTSTIVEHYVVDAVRLPTGLTARASAGPVQLSVGEQADVELTFAAIAYPPPAAGATMVGVLVSSPHRPQVRRVEELVLDVEPLPGLVASLEPTSATGRRRGEIELVLRNSGNARLEVDLTGRDPQNKVKMALGASRVPLAPGASARVTAVLSGRPVLLGQPVRHQVAFGAQGYTAASAPGTTATSGAPGAPVMPVPPWAGQAEFVQPPLIGRAVVRAVGAMFGIVTLSGALAVGGMAVRGALKDKATAKPSTSSPATSAPVSTSGSPSPSPSPSASTSTPAAPTTSAPTSPTAPKATTLDFTVPPPGGKTTSQILVAKAYPGVTLAAPTSPSCAVTGSNLLWIDTAGLRFAGPGHSDPAKPTTLICQDGPLQLTPAAPAPALTVTLLGVAGPEATGTDLAYAITFRDGSGAAYTSQQTVKPGQTATSRLVDPSGKGLTDVTVAPVTSGAGVLVGVTALTIG